MTENEYIVELMKDGYTEATAKEMAEREDEWTPSVHDIIANGLKVLLEDGRTLEEYKYGGLIDEDGDLWGTNEYGDLQNMDTGEIGHIVRIRVSRGNTNEVVRNQ